MYKVLITGGAGFIGSYLSNRLINEKTFYYKGTLTKSDIILREKLDKIIVKDKIINNLENNVSDLETDITQLKKTIEDGIVEITNLNKEIDILKKKIQDTITIKNKETDVIESTYQNYDIKVYFLKKTGGECFDLDNFFRYPRRKPKKNRKNRGKGALFLYQITLQQSLHEKLIYECINLRFHRFIRKYASYFS